MLVCSSTDIYVSTKTIVQANANLPSRVDRPFPCLATVVRRRAIRGTTQLQSGLDQGRQYVDYVDFIAGVMTHFRPRVVVRRRRVECVF